MNAKRRESYWYVAGTFGSEKRANEVKDEIIAAGKQARVENRKYSFYLMVLAD